LMTRTNTGEGTRPPSGKKVVTYEAQFGSLNAEGKIAADHHHADQITMASQMGMLTWRDAPDSETLWPEKLVVIAKNDDNEKANLALVASLRPLFDKQDSAGILAMMSEDVELRYVPSKEIDLRLETPAPRKLMFETVLKMNFDVEKPVSHDVTSAWAAGDWVVTVSDVTSELKKNVTLPKSKGPKPRTKGKRVKTTQTEFFQISEGKIQSYWIFENAMQAIVQLGYRDPMMGAHPKPKK